MKHGARICLVATTALAASCADPPPAPPFQASLHVESDPGVPVAGAIVYRGTKQIATT